MLGWQECVVEEVKHLMAARQVCGDGDPFKDLLPSSGLLCPVSTTSNETIKL